MILNGSTTVPLCMTFFSFKELENGIIVTQKTCCKPNPHFQSYRQSTALNQSQQLSIKGRGFPPPPV